MQQASYQVSPSNSPSPAIKSSRHKKHRKRKDRPTSQRKQDFESAAQNSFQADELSSYNNLDDINNQNNTLTRNSISQINLHKQQILKQRKRSNVTGMDLGSRASSSFQNAHRLSNQVGTQEQTNGESAANHSISDGSQSQLIRPYEFLKFANPPVHMILIPHFAVKSITFGLSILLIIMFAVLLIYNYTQPQNDFRWNCSLYELQNKFFPKLRYDYQFWRVLVSGFFHSNIAHFCLNLVGLQVYGYFVEWYFGITKYVLTLLACIVLGHFFSAAVDTESISTMASSLLFGIIALKIWFLYEYWYYKPLQHRRSLIIILLALIITMNLIPLFVVNNIDYAGHLGGLICGGLLGGFYHFSKMQEKIQTDQQRSEYPKKWKVLKWIFLACVPVYIIACIIVVFTTDTLVLEGMSNRIGQKCSQ